MEELLKRLEIWLKENRPEFYDELAPSVTAKALSSLSTLPEELKVLLLWHNGMTNEDSEALETNRVLMSCESIAETIATMNDLFDADEFEEPFWWKKGWIPFMDNGGGDYLCIDTVGCFGGSPGQIIEFWHADGDRNIVYPNLLMWLDCLVEALEKNLLECEDGDVFPTDEKAYKDFMKSKLPDYPKRFDAAAGAQK